jgi:hypothetical protein
VFNFAVPACALPHLHSMSQRRIPQARRRFVLLPRPAAAVACHPQRLRSCRSLAYAEVVTLRLRLNHIVWSMVQVGIAFNPSVYFVAFHQLDAHAFLVSSAQNVY